MPSRLKPSQGVILFASLDALVAALPETESWLSPDETARLSRLLRPKDRELQSAAHRLKRFLLGRLLQAEPSSFRFERDARGRPHLISPADVDVNLSHGADHVVVGIAHGGRVGVDVERDGAQIDWFEIAPHVLHPSEDARARTLPPETMRRFCLERWCLKEAVAKATGEGLPVASEIITPSDCSEGWRLQRAGLDLSAGHLMLAPNICGAWALSADCAATILVLQREPSQAVSFSRSASR